MNFIPYLEKVSKKSRPCTCGENHDLIIIQGALHYAEAAETIFVAGLAEHNGEKHIWLSFITGEWPNTNQADCYVTCHVWKNFDQQIMQIENATEAPFLPAEVFNCYPVSREQVFSVEGAKEWYIKVYLLLFELNQEIGTYIK